MRKVAFCYDTGSRDLSKVVARSDNLKVVGLVRDANLGRHTTRNIVATFKKRNGDLVTKHVNTAGKVGTTNSDFDLFIVNTQRHGYINLYKQSNGKLGNRNLTVYKSARKAQAAAAGKRNVRVIAQRVQWVEAA